MVKTHFFPLGLGAFVLHCLRNGRCYSAYAPRYSTPLILATLSISTLVPLLLASCLPASGMVSDEIIDCSD